MSQPLNILVVEDSQADAEILMRQIRRGGYDPAFQQVDTPEAMSEALDRQSWDIVISDYVMPRFSGLAALDLLKEKELDLPFIIVSGKIGEDTAVEAMKAGAHDYILKGNFARLIPAIQRELREAVVRRARREADEALRRAHAELETRVIERTAELAKANEELQVEVAERKRLGEQLRQINERLTVTSIQVKKQAEETEERNAEWRALFEGISDAIFVVEEPGRVVAANRAGLNLLGIESIEGLQNDLAKLEQAFDLRYPDDRPVAPGERPSDILLRSEKFHNLPYQIVNSQGQVRDLLVSGGMIETAETKPRRGLQIIRDVTEMRELERLREEFVRLISHDLRNPLTGLMGYAQLLRIGLAQKGLEQEVAHVDQVLQSAKRMNAMIQDLVESSHLESGYLEMQKTPIDLPGLVSNIAKRAASIEDLLRIRVECPESMAPIALDQERIDRAITNLITNALKYSPPNAPVIVRLAQQNGEAIISVTDKGLGIPAEEVPNLFQRFYRAKTGQKIEGLGLGLYITRLIVEAHGGRIWVESEAGKGSSFYIALPIDASPSGASPGAREQESYVSEL